MAPARVPRGADRARGRARSAGRRGSGRSRRSPLVFTILFTVFLTNPAGLWDGLHDGLAYWLGQHGEGRGEKEWYFYIVVLVRRGVAGAAARRGRRVAALRRPTLLRLFLIWDFVLSLAVYCWANERFTWLVLHPLLPLLLLAGLGVQAIWDARAALDRAGSASRVVRRCACAVTGITSWRANVENGADPRRVPRHHAVGERGRATCATRSTRSPSAPSARGATSTSSSTPPRARPSRGRGTSATCRSATWT